MQERHDNDKIEPHNHNEYPLLYKEAKLLTSVLGRFLECRKWNILVITWALGIFLIYMPAPSGLRPSGLGIYIRQIPLAHGITITYKANNAVKMLLIYMHATYVQLENNAVIMLLIYVHACSMCTIIKKTMLS